MWIDCDVLTADGGTRCASITGGYVALALALKNGRRRRRALTEQVAAISRGIVDGTAAARPRLQRGLERRGRRERRDDRRRARSSRSRRPPSARRCSARTSTTCSRSPRPGIDELRAVQDAGDRGAMRLVLSTRNAAQGARVRPLLGAARARPAARTTSSCRPRPARRSPRTRSARRAPRRRRPAAPAFADDSGIAAEALGGAPGVRSARATPARTPPTRRTSHKLLREAPAGSRVAYVCALAYVDRSGVEHVVEGRCEGTLAAEPRGTGGFGYDPAFVPDEHPDRTMAELDAARRRTRSATAASAARALLRVARRLRASG